MDVAPGPLRSVRPYRLRDLRQGGIQALFYFDVHGPSPEEVKNIMIGVCARLAKEPGVVYALGEIEPTIESQGLHSTSAEVKLLAKDYETLTRLSATYSPIAIELLKPSEVKLSLYSAQSSLLIVSQMSHSYTKMIMEKVLKPEERDEYIKKIGQREILGKRLLEKSREDEAAKKAEAAKK